MTQNAGRLPIIDQTVGAIYSVVRNPFGGDEEVSGFYISRNDPRERFPEILGFLGAHSTYEAANAELDKFLEDEA